VQSLAGCHPLRAILKKFLAAAIPITGCLTALGKPEISDLSPDKKYALWQEYADKQPYYGDVKLIEAQSGHVIVTLDTQVEPFSKRLLWPKNSERFAYFNDSGRNGVTRIFFREKNSFDEVKMPELAQPALPPLASEKDNSSETRTRIEPLRWTDSGELILEKELTNDKWGRAALEVRLAFDQERHASVAEFAQQPPSIVDYFLLLPADNFEGAPSGWLALMRANGNTIDKKNGYMSCPGDGAQPEFEVTLFRYHDGRPLLALCSGELEGADSIFLRFFELAPNGAMQPVNHWLFPIPDGGYDPETGTTKANWEFKLPRTGKTIRIQSQTGHKVLHKLTWNGERFEKEK
jgi:hypothetical protein